MGHHADTRGQKQVIKAVQGAFIQDFKLLLCSSIINPLLSNFVKEKTCGRSDRRDPENLVIWVLSVNPLGSCNLSPFWGTHSGSAPMSLGPFLSNLGLFQGQP